jgi:hypothetical protein
MSRSYLGGYNELTVIELCSVDPFGFRQQLNLQQRDYHLVSEVLKNVSCGHNALWMHVTYSLHELHHLPRLFLCLGRL